jgi:predicted MFS family arabinose efflux permease
VPAVILAMFGYALLRNRPAEAPWLASDERAWLQDKLDAEAEAKPGHGHSLLRSIANPQFVTLTIAYTLIAYGVYAIAFFLPLMVKTMGLSNTAIGYVLVLPNLFGTIGMILLSRSSDHSGERIWHVVVPVGLAGAGAIAAGLLLGNIYLTMAAFCVAVFGIASCLPVFWNLPTAYLGATAAAGGIAFINSVGNISGYVAPQITGLLRDTSGGYTVPMLVTGGLVLLAAVLILASGIRKHVPRGAPLPAHGTLLH